MNTCAVTFALSTVLLLKSVFAQIHRNTQTLQHTFISVHQKVNGINVISGLKWDAAT